MLKPLQWHVLLSMHFFKSFCVQFSPLLPDLPLSMIQKGSETAEPLGFSIYYLSWDPMQREDLSPIYLVSF